jgi:hypothetical protein
LQNKLNTRTPPPHWKMPDLGNYTPWSGLQVLKKNCPVLKWWKICFHDDRQSCRLPNVSFCCKPCWLTCPIDIMKQAEDNCQNKMSWQPTSKQKSPCHRVQFPLHLLCSDTSSFLNNCIYGFSGTGQTNSKTRSLKKNPLKKGNIV